jgi:predicted lipid-binding transport protein (Tim44 family)
MFNVSPDLIILGLIAGVILFRLYTTLGRKDNDSYTPDMKQAPAGLKGVIDISASARTEEIVDLAVIEKDIAPGFEEVLTKIRKIDNQFSMQKFLDGSKKAFEMVLSSFADNDRDTLKDLLGKDTYQQFISEIDKRLKNKVTLNLTLVALPVVDIKDIRFRNNIVSIDMFYSSQQIHLLKNEAGEIIEGDSSQIDTVEDFWTFEKKLNSKMNWQLVRVNAS